MQTVKGVEARGQQLNRNQISVEVASQGEAEAGVEAEAGPEVLDF